MRDLKERIEKLKNLGWRFEIYSANTMTCLQSKKEDRHLAILPGVYGTSIILNIDVPNKDLINNACSIRDSIESLIEKTEKKEEEISHALALISNAWEIAVNLGFKKV